MKVLKFGGGCLKDSESIKIFFNILKKYDTNVIIVVSAFDKLTNLLETIYFSEKKSFTLVESFFKDLMLSLKFSNKLTDSILMELSRLTSSHLSEADTLAIGELISSKILSEYLHELKFGHTFLHAPNIIKTNSLGINSSINLESTIIEKNNYISCYSNNLRGPILTQGFIGGFDDNGTCQTTCIGREGSDYSAAIFGSIFNATQVILFKDVDGIYSVDPKQDNSAKLFSSLSYEDAFNICNQKNTVVHPKTISQLKDKRIPLVIKNFKNFEKPGTIII